MWDFIMQPGIAMAVVDFTADLSPLLVSLMSLLGLSAGMIVVMATRHYLAQKTQPAAKIAHTDQREAA
jgi:F0F1-type ATP synthase assembly protein I